MLRQATAAHGLEESATVCAVADHCCKQPWPEVARGIERVACAAETCRVDTRFSGAEHGRTCLHSEGRAEPEDRDEQDEGEQPGRRRHVCLGHDNDERGVWRPECEPCP